jgi:hypothetical protein
MLLAACAGGSMQTASQTPSVAVEPVALNIVPPAVSRLFHSDAHAPAVIGPVNPAVNQNYVTTLQAYGSDAKVYTQNPPATRPRVQYSLGTTLQFFESFTMDLYTPYGATITPSRDWYVTNSGAPNVALFRIGGSGKVTLRGILSDPNGIPVDVASTATSSLVAVSNNSSTGSTTQGFIALYVDGFTTPSGTLTVTNPAAKGLGIALDKAGDCFWSYNTSSPQAGTIVEFPKCGGTAKTVVTGLIEAGGIAINKANDLFYVDQMAGTVSRCKGSKACKELASGFEDPFMIKFDAGWKHLWLTDAETATIYALDPTTGAILSATPAQGGPTDPPFGIATAPGPKY